MDLIFETRTRFVSSLFFSRPFSIYMDSGGGDHFGRCRLCMAQWWCDTVNVLKDIPVSILHSVLFLFRELIFGSYRDFDWIRFIINSLTKKNST